MGRRPVTIASLLTFTCAAGSMVVAPINAEGAGFHEGWCQKDEGFAVVLYWPAKPADVKPEVPGNLNSKTLVRCIIGSHNVSGPDGRADALTLAGFSHDGGTGQIVNRINDIEADPYAEIPATWWYHTGTWEEGSGGRWDETPRWDPNLKINGFSVVVFSSDNEQLPPITPTFAKGGDHGDEPGPGPGPGPGPSTGPTGKPSHGPAGKPTHKPTGGHDKPTRKPTHGPGHGGDKPSHEPGHGHGGDHHNRPNSTAPKHSTGPKPGKNHDNTDSRPNTIATARPTTTSPTPSPRPSSPSTTPSSPTPTPSASSPAASAGSSLAPQSSSSPVWGREDRTRRSPDKGEHEGAPWWVPVGVGVITLVGPALAAIGRRHSRRPEREDEE